MYSMALEHLEKVCTVWFGTFRNSSNCRNFTFTTRQKDQQENKTRLIGDNVKKNTLNTKLINSKIRQYGQREIIQHKVLNITLKGKSQTVRPR